MTVLGLYQTENNSIKSINKSFQNSILKNLLKSIKVRVFFGKKIEEKYMCRHDKNYYDFGKSNITVIKFQKIRLFKKLDKRRESILPNTDKSLAFFIVFEWGSILESATDK